MRDSTPLITSAPPPKLYGGLEVLITEARLRHSGIHNGVRHTQESSHLTVLLAFDPSEAQRRTLRAVAGNLVAASCEFLSPPTAPGFGARLAKILHEHEAAYLNIAIALPDFSSAVGHQLRELLFTIRASHHHQIGLIVGTATTPSDWVACEGIDGFVEAGMARRMSDALHVFKVLAAFMAPGVLMSCFDVEDFREVLWPTQDGAPARVIEAVWKPRDAGIVFSTETDRNLVFGSQSLVLLLPCTTSTKMQDVVHFLKAIKSQISDEACLSYATPFGLMGESETSTDLVSIVILCR